MDKHKNKQQLVQELAPKAKYESFKMQVEMLELQVRRNKAQKELVGEAIESHLDSFIDIELNFTERHPELLPVLIEERNSFLNSVGISEEIYLQELARDREGRKPKPQNPSEQLHAIKEEIQSHSDTMIDVMNEEPHGEKVEEDSFPQMQTPENTSEVPEKDPL